MRALAALLLACAACGGPLSNARLQPVAESQRRALVTITLSNLDRTDGLVRAWTGGDPEASAGRDLLFRLHGFDAAAASEVATDRPAGLSIVPADQPGAAPLRALAFALRESVAAKGWLERLGEISARSGALAQVIRASGDQTEALYFHVDGSDLIFSNTLPGLLVAGPAARAACQAAAADVTITVRPRAGSPEELARQLAAFLELLRRGRSREQALAGTAGLLATARARAQLEPFLKLDALEATVKVGTAGAELQLRATGAAGAPPLAPVLDRSLGGEGVAALGALDCRGQIAGQRRAIGAWRASGGPGAAELDRLAGAEQTALDGTCSFAVRTTGEVWSEEASYPLRAASAGAPLIEALTAAIRSGGLPNLKGAADELRTEKLLFSAERGTLSLDRILGGAGTAGTRHAAALHGAAVLRDRFVVRGGRLLAISGAHADDRLARIAKDAPAPLPVELERALAGGRGKGGHVFLDLGALWKPYLKAAQVTQGSLANVVARNPVLLQERRPLVLTIEPTPGLDATVTMPPATVMFLLGAAAALFF